jgi:hypothetical protein
LSAGMFVNMLVTPNGHINVSGLISIFASCLTTFALLFNVIKQGWLQPVIVAARIVQLQ